MAAVVQMCGACDRARQSFNRPHATLSPLSIRGLLYRWSIDLCGPFPLTRQLNSYCMVLVLPVGRDGGYSWQGVGHYCPGVFGEGGWPLRLLC